VNIVDLRDTDFILQPIQDIMLEPVAERKQLQAFRSKLCRIRPCGFRRMMDIAPPCDHDAIGDVARVTPGDAASGTMAFVE
jgi:hypothetical protein